MLTKAEFEKRNGAKNSPFHSVNFREYWALCSPSSILLIPRQFGINAELSSSELSSSLDSVLNYWVEDNSPSFNIVTTLAEVKQNITDYKRHKANFSSYATDAKDNVFEWNDTDGSTFYVQKYFIGVFLKIINLLQKHGLSTINDELDIERYRQTNASKSAKMLWLRWNGIRFGIMSMHLSLEYEDTSNRFDIRHKIRNHKQPTP
jgi:hypothetical protein